MQPHDNAENANQSTGTPASPAQANDYRRQKAGPPGSALYYALLQLPPSKRDAAYAVHAFCQEIADIHAAVHDPGVAHAKLDWWRQELARLFSGAPAHPVARALAPVIDNARLNRAQFEAVLHGAEMDLSQMRYLDFAGLSHYCDAAGGAPAELASHIYGFDNDSTPALARALGVKAVISGEGATVTLADLEQSSLLPRRPGRLGRCLLSLVHGFATRATTGHADTHLGTRLFRLALGTDAFKTLGAPLSPKSLSLSFRRRQEAGDSLYKGLVKLRSQGGAGGWRIKRQPDPVVSSRGVLLPDLTLTMYVYAPDPHQRFVVIKGDRHVEGDDLGDGVTLREIRADGMLLEFKGKRFLYPRDGR